MAEKKSLTLIFSDPLLCPLNWTIDADKRLIEIEGEA